MKILSFDQSMTNSACVVLTVGESGSLDIERSHTLVPKSDGIARLMDIRGWIDHHVSFEEPTLLVRELHHQRTWGAASQLHALAGFIDSLAWEKSFLLDSRYVMIPSTTWKKFCFGKGNFKKDTCYLLAMNKFFRATAWLTTPEDDITNDNVGDAICIGITGYVAYRQHVLKQSDSLLAYQTDSLKKAASMFNY